MRRKVKEEAGLVRRAITKVIAINDAVLTDEATSTRVLQKHLELVLAKQAELTEFGCAIQDTLTDADVEVDLNKAFEYEQKFSFTKTIRALQCNLPGQRTLLPLLHPPECCSRRRSPALPKLHIPIFSGERRDWKCFWNQCQASIQGDGSLSNIDKFKYLLTCLSGPAKTAIQGIRFGEAHYNVAIKVLFHRLSRPHMLVDEHLYHLLAVLPIRCSAYLNKLPNLYDEITFRTSTLEGLGVSPDEYAAVLRRVIMKALPLRIGILYHPPLKESS
ncbi:uncharacterized protein [Dermacentor andersoni]|uniref:uncharacterized protein n=1 Tax=Dermacentor andersoni TaxID=34620 RepID=UPI003B3B097B